MTDFEIAVEKHGKVTGSNKEIKYFFLRCTRNEENCLWPLCMADLSKKSKVEKSWETNGNKNFWVDWQRGDSLHRFLKDMTKDEI